MKKFLRWLRRLIFGGNRRRNSRPSLLALSMAEFNGPKRRH